MGARDFGDRSLLYRRCAKSAPAAKPSLLHPIMVAHRARIVQSRGNVRNQIPPVSDDNYRPPPTRAGLSKRRGRSNQGHAPPAVHGTRTHHSSRSERYAWATTYGASAIATPPIRCRDSPNPAMAMPQWSPVSRRSAGWRRKFSGVVSIATRPEFRGWVTTVTC